MLAPQVPRPPYSISERLENQVAFLFEDAGDKVFYIAGQGGLSAMVFDAIENESHKWDIDVTQYPVEAGSDISDNIQARPAELTVTAFISNTPVHGLIDEVVNFADRFLNGRKRTQEAFNQLLALRNSEKLVTVATRYAVYENAAITGVNIVRQPEDGESLTVEISFREVNIVNQQTGSVPPGLGGAGKQSDNTTKKRAGTKVDAGKSTGSASKPGAPASAKEQSVGKVLGDIFGIGK